MEELSADEVRSLYFPTVTLFNLKWNRIILL